MSYIAKGRRYTYGVKSTLTEVGAILSPSSGDTVFCEENKRLMTYDGQLWMCNDFIKLTNVSGSALAEGEVAVASTATAGGVTRTAIITNGDPLTIGPVVFGNTNNNPVAIAIFGIYNVLTDSSTNAGDYALSSWSNVGTAVSSTTMGDGFFGVFVERKLSAGLTKCFIRSKPEFN